MEKFLLTICMGVIALVAGSQETYAEGRTGHGRGPVEHHCYSRSEGMWLILREGVQLGSRSRPAGSAIVMGYGFGNNPDPIDLVVCRGTRKVFPSRPAIEKYTYRCGGKADASLFSVKYRGRTAPGRGSVSLRVEPKGPIIRVSDLVCEGHF